MYRFAANLASKARVAKICTQSASSRLSLSRNYAAKDVKELADAVKVITGPKGRNVIIEQIYGAPKVGKEGIITIADGKTLHIELEVVEGVKLDRGYLSPYFLTNPTNQKCELDDPLVLIHEKKISDLNAIEKVLKVALKRERSMLIIAGDVESQVLTRLKRKGLYDEIKVCAVRAPAENRKAILQDLATFTGGELITEELGIKLEEVELKMLGSCKKVTVSKDDTVIQDGAGNKKLLQERCEQIRSAIELSTSDYDKEKLQERLAKLSGCVLKAKFYRPMLMEGDQDPAKSAPLEGTEEDDEMNWKIGDKRGQSIKMLERECYRNPNNARNFRRWGIALMGISWFRSTNNQRRIIAEAITKLEKALSLDPKDDKSMLRLTEAYKQLVQLCEDTELLPVALSGKASSINENKYMEDDEMDEEICDTCEIESKHNPYIVDNWKCWGTSLMKLSRRESGIEKRCLIAEAIAKFEKALELEPNDNETKQQLAEAYDQFLTKRELFRNVLSAAKDVYLSCGDKCYEGSCL